MNRLDMTVEPVDSADGILRVNVTRTCPLCDKASRVDNVPAEGFRDWQDRRQIQLALPELTPGQRKTLMSGCHEKCFDRAFPAVDPEDAQWPAETWFDPVDFRDGEPAESMNPSYPDHDYDPGGP